MKYVLLVIGICLTLSIKGEISYIPQGGVWDIEYLFEHLIDSHDFAYTMFGSKPMSLADYGLKVPSPRPIHRWIRSFYLYVKAKKSLNAWYKYRDEFDFKDFIFLDEENDWINDCLVLFLINKKNMLRVLQEHESIFREELGESFTPVAFLERLEKREVSLANAINGSQRLMGIMLGYGVRNATLFQERYDIVKVIWKREKENMSEDEILAKKLADVEEQCGDFSELDADAVIHPLYFLADVTHPETIALQQKYEQERQQIIELRKKRNFMDLVLQRLVSTE